MRTNEFLFSIFPVLLEKAREGGLLNEEQAVDVSRTVMNLATRDAAEAVVNRRKGQLSEMLHVVARMPFRFDPNRAAAEQVVEAAERLLDEVERRANEWHDGRAKSAEA